MLAGRTRGAPPSGVTLTTGGLFETVTFRTPVARTTVPSFTWRVTVPACPAEPAVYDTDTTLVLPPPGTTGTLGKAAGSTLQFDTPAPLHPAVRVYEVVTTPLFATVNGKVAGPGVGEAGAVAGVTLALATATAIEP